VSWRARYPAHIQGLSGTIPGKRFREVFEGRRNHSRMKALPRIGHGLLRLGRAAGSVPDIHIVHEHRFPRGMKFKNRRHAVRLFGDEESAEGRLHDGRRRCARAPPSGLVFCDWNGELKARVPPTHAFARCARNTCAEVISTHGLRHRQRSKSSDARRLAPEDRIPNATIVLSQYFIHLYSTPA
jgi:hypothetical protein